MLISPRAISSTQGHRVSRSDSFAAGYQIRLPSEELGGFESIRCVELLFLYLDGLAGLLPVIRPLAEHRVVRNVGEWGEISRRFISGFRVC